MEDIKIYPRVIERIEDWPIYRQSKDRQEFIRQIDEYTFARLKARHGDLIELLTKTIYQERLRLKETAWKVDPPNERSFWNKISSRLIRKSLDRTNDPEGTATAERILQQIIHRYSEEIVGTFQVATFRFAQRFLTVLFNRLFNAAVERSIRSLWRGRRQLYEQLHVVGDVEKVRTLFQHGTVVVLPTHYSNLDSILVGYAMDQIMGLPSFSYGAGLNLYNFGPAAYFMNRLGAYRVDRRKKNTVYLETLKAMSNLSIQRGVNNLFFPGGTRSRSGALESELKMGLLGTAVEAQRAMCQRGEGRKVFIVPMVISYHFVLEAPYLIEQHLRSTGKENYLRLKDEGQSIRGWLKFIWRFFSTTSDITLSVGKPMDVLGNFVDERGDSYDRFGTQINIEDYFKAFGEINEDRQREEEYTKLMAERIIRRYKVENVVLSSHLAAFAVFEILLHEHKHLDLYGILRLDDQEHEFEFDTVEKVVEQLQVHLRAMEQREEIKLSPEIHLPAAEVLRSGVKRLGVFHTDKPLLFNRAGNVISKNFRTLYYYHNRLEGYELEKAIIIDKQVLAMEKV